MIKMTYNIQKNKTNKKKGLSIAEILFVISIGAFLIVGSLLTVRAVNDVITVNKHALHIATIHSNIKEMFRDELVLNYNTPAYAEAGLFPEYLLQHDNYWKARTYTGAMMRISRSHDAEVRFHYNKIERRHCVKILQSQKDVGWVSYGTSHGTGTTFSWAKNEYADKGKYSDFVEACNVNSNLVNIAFRAAK